MLVIPTLNPALLVRAGEEDGFSKFEHVVIADLRKGARLTRSKPTWDESIILQLDSVGRPFRLFPTVEEVDWFFERFQAACVRHPHLVASGDLSLTIDVETTKDAPLLSQLICIGFGFLAPDEEQVLNVPILSCGGFKYWTERDEVHVRETMRRVLATPDITTSFHNKGFDKAVMWANGMPIAGWSNCSMNAHHIWDAELPHNLGFVGSLFTDGRYWKDDAKGDGGFLGIPDYTLRKYNISDVLITQRILPVLHSELRRLKLWPLYIEQLQCTEVMTRASIRGMLVDETRRTSTERDEKGKFIGLKPTLEAQRDEALATLRTVAKDSTFDPARPVSVADLLFTKLGFSVVARSEKTGAPKVDKESLMLLELLASGPEQRAALKGLIQFRQAEKLLSTFVTGLSKFIHPATWRFHTQWKLLAVSGRFTSSPNAQNWPNVVKRMFAAAEGYDFVGIDLSQAELRFIAYLANDATLLKMYADGINVHTVNACLLFKIQCPEPSDINSQTEAFIRTEMLRVHGVDYSTLPMLPLTNWKPVRTLAKSYVFAANYGAEAETVYKVLRSKRDSDTNKLLFPTLLLSEIQALRVMWLKKLHPEIPKFWDDIQIQIKKSGGYFCPISGRARLFRGGYNRNECLNFPIQAGVASWMNKALVRIQRRFDEDTGGQAQVIQQVHDAINVESPKAYSHDAGIVMCDIVNESFQLLGHKAVLPADPAKIHKYLDKV